VYQILLIEFQFKKIRIELTHKKIKFYSTAWHKNNLFNVIKYPFCPSPPLKVAIIGNCSPGIKVNYTGKTFEGLGYLGYNKLRKRPPESIDIEKDAFNRTEI